MEKRSSSIFVAFAVLMLVQVCALSMVVVLRRRAMMHQEQQQSGMDGSIQRSTHGWLLHNEESESEEEEEIMARNSRTLRAAPAPAPPAEGLPSYADSVGDALPTYEAPGPKPDEPAAPAYAVESTA